MVILCKPACFSLRFEVQQQVTAQHGVGQSNVASSAHNETDVWGLKCYFRTFTLWFTGTDLFAITFSLLWKWEDKVQALQVDSKICPKSMARTWIQKKWAMWKSPSRSVRSRIELPSRCCVVRRSSDESFYQFQGVYGYSWLSCPETNGYFDT